jgi:DNA invertase Pin-like site-specific DNA recombinase
METYQQSVLEYHDVRQAVDYAEREGHKKGRREGKREGKREGIEIGEKRGRIEGVEIGEKRGVEREGIRFVKNCYAANMSIETIAALTGFSEGQIYDILNNG